jgi:hypothetical protein
MSDDKPIQHRIEELVSQEHELRAKLAAGEITEAEEQERLRQLETELDQTWDLLRQRRAKREYGDDPDTARTRSADTVEGYLS